MNYISVSIDVDISDIIDNMSKNNKRDILRDISDKELFEELKDRNIKLEKSVEIGEFTLLSSYKKREYLIKLLDLPHYANDELIINSIRENI